MPHITATTFHIDNFTCAFLLYFINPHNRMHWNIATRYAVKLIFELFFAGIDHNLALLAKNNLLDLNKTIHIALVNRPRVEFIDLVVIIENNFVNRSLGHSLSVV